MERSEVKRSEVEGSEVDRSEVERSEVERSEVDRSEVDRSEVTKWGKTCLDAHATTRKGADGNKCGMIFFPRSTCLHPRRNSYPR
ncbi:hypothetical protein POWCR01_120006400 [Plasmodium ovale]|uniref:Uncharacterized protein n=1 Tax=Plasmodium ovale TaxID=36330 RepID=A0A1C3KUQ3_PLAOA|nr:hypothetical protein POWCR01_120006400 [Plasmodium ovale]